MSTIDDIINAADEEFHAVMGKNAEWEDSIAGTGDLSDPNGGPTAADTFIGKMSPRHARLMEDERKAAEAFLADACIVNNVCHECDGADGCTIRLLRVSLDALDAYRKERD